MKWLFWPAESDCPYPRLYVTLTWTDTDTTKQWGNLNWSNGETKAVCPTSYGCLFHLRFSHVHNYEYWRFIGENYGKTYTQTPYGNPPPTSVPTYSAATGGLRLHIGGFFTDTTAAPSYHSVRNRYGGMTWSWPGMYSTYIPGYYYTPTWNPTYTYYVYPGTKVNNGKLRMRNETGTAPTTSTVTSNYVSTKWLGASGLVTGGTSTAAKPFQLKDNTLFGYLTTANGVTVSWEPADAFGCELTP